MFLGLRVRDVDAAARFYRAAFDVDVSGEAEVRIVLAPAGELGFVVDDLEAAHARAVAAGAQVSREPRDGSAAYLDPDGNVVTLTERPRPFALPVSTWRAVRWPSSCWKATSRRRVPL